MSLRVDDDIAKDVEDTSKPRNNAGPLVAAHSVDQYQHDLTVNNSTAADTNDHELTNEPKEFTDISRHKTQHEGSRPQLQELELESRMRIAVDVEGVVSGFNSANEMKLKETDSDAVVEKDIELGEGDAAEDDSSYPSGSALAVLTTGLCLATFVVSSFMYMQ